MKTKNVFLGMLMCSTVGLTTSCLSEVNDLELKSGQNEEQKGQLILNLNSSTDFSSQTRALNEANYRNTDNFTVQLFNSANQVMLECKASELNNNLPRTLEIGSYEVKAFYGNEVAASRNEFRVEGSQTFTIKANQSEQRSMLLWQAAIHSLLDSDIEMYQVLYPDHPEIAAEIASREAREVLAFIGE